MKKKLAIVLAVALLLTMLGGLTACSSDDGTFTWLLSKGADESFISSYNENPSIKYLLSKEYNGNKLDIDFKTMVAGSESDQFQTMISTGEYYDILDVVYSGYSVETLYEMGIALDLTELIEEYMPNYVKFVNSNEELKMYAYTEVDGEKKMLQIVGGGDSPTLAFEGYMYRRDWIVKYGTNPSTGEPFTGGYSAKNADGTNDVNSWSDNIVFPSWYLDNKYVTEYKANHPEWDGTDPVFISDWEWMFGVFEKAFEDLGVTDSYMMSMYYLGYLETGDFYSSFGGGSPLWSKDENGNVTFNASSDSMKAYLECLNAWYEKGWLDQEFNERSSAGMFWTIDVAASSQGKVPMFCGGLGKIGNSLETEEYPLTKDMMLAPARLPINDVYGTENEKGIEPDGLYEGTYYKGSVIITSNAANKDLETLLTFIDSLYTDDAMMVMSLGLNAEQYEEIKDSLEKNKDGLDIMERYNMQSGAYYYEDGKLFRADAISDVNYLQQAACADRVCIGKKLIGGISLKNSVMTKAYEEWMIYTSSSNVSNYSSFFNEEDSTTYSRVRNSINTKMSVEIPKFIMGEYNLDSDFETFAKTINKMGHAKVTAIFENYTK